MINELINEKEQLLEQLKTYRGILTSPTISYLNSLLELEFSVVRDYNAEDRQALSELEIYRKIAQYNIYNRALKIFENDKDIKTFSMKNLSTNLEAFIPTDDGNADLFEFLTPPFISESKIPQGYKTAHIGNIYLSQILESKELREEELNRVINELDKLYNAKNPYFTRGNKIGGSSAVWEHKRQMKIQEYEGLFTKLDSRRELSDEEKKKIEISNRIHELLLEDYGLNDECFEELTMSSMPIQARHYMDKSKTHKTLVLKKELKRPNLTITNDIKYL